MNQLDDALRQQARELALTVPCSYCKACKGEKCWVPSTGHVLLKQPAHTVRLQDAGVLPRGGGHG